MKRTYLYSMLALCVSAACHAETYPAPIGPSQSDFGGVGLLQTPTARMAREGEISLNYRDNDQYRYYSASVQLFPWLETTLRYTDVRTKQYSSVEAFSGAFGMFRQRQFPGGEEQQPPLLAVSQFTIHTGSPLSLPIRQHVSGAPCCLGVYLLEFIQAQ